MYKKISIGTIYYSFKYNSYIFQKKKILKIKNNQFKNPTEKNQNIENKIKVIYIFLIQG